MNAPPEEDLPQDQRLLDQLADGELDTRQQRALFHSLDQQPGLWRQCALTLLEAQCWRNEMTALAQQAAAGSPPGGAAVDGSRCHRDAHRVTGPNASRPTGRGDPMQVVSSSSASSRHRTAGGDRPHAGRLLALAAGLLLAFALGIAARDVLSRNGSGAAPEPRIGTASLAVDALTPIPPASLPADAPAPTKTKRAADQERLAAAQEPTGTTDATPDLTGDMITLLVRAGHGSAASQVRVPLVSAKGMSQAGIAPAWLAASQSPLPDLVVQRLERAGHQVHWQRRYAPVQLDDGRQVVFPVDDIEIAPVVFQPL